MIRRRRFLAGLGAAGAVAIAKPSIIIPAFAQTPDFTATISGGKVLIAINPAIPADLNSVGATARNPLVIPLQASWSDKRVIVDKYRPTSVNPNGPCITFQIPDSAGSGALPSDFNIRIKSRDPQAGAIAVRAAAGSDRVEHYWGSDHPYGRFIVLVRDGAELYDNGTDANGSFRDWGLDYFANSGRPTEQLTIASPDRANYPINPSCEGKILCASASGCGGTTTLYLEGPEVWCPPSPLTGGNYRSCVFWVQKIDSDATGWGDTGGTVRIATNIFRTGYHAIWGHSSNQTSGVQAPLYNANDPVINGAAYAIGGASYRGGYHYLTTRGQCVQVIVRADCAMVINSYQPASGSL